MLCPQKQQPAGLDDVGFMWVSNKWDYVRHLQCSCLITLESITYSISPGKKKQALSSWTWMTKDKQGSTFPDLCMEQYCQSFMCVYFAGSSVFNCLNVWEILDLSAQLHLLCGYCSVFMSVRACECISVCVQHAESLWPLLTRHSNMAYTQSQINAVLKQKKQNKIWDYFTTYNNRYNVLAAAEESTWT